MLAVMADVPLAALDDEALAERARGWAPLEGGELLGTLAPELRGVEWLQGGPLTLVGLGGKVVLIRFWLTGCAYCEATAPALNELHDAYAAKGLVVVGLHHPKSDEIRDRAVVERAVRQLGFRFPVGIDPDWKTANAYGVGTVFREFTSVSILVDRRDDPLRSRRRRVSPRRRAGAPRLQPRVRRAARRHRAAAFRALASRWCAWPTRLPARGQRQLMR
jgi:thiol-disulfide isomerase/thioredoxin